MLAGEPFPNKLLEALEGIVEVVEGAPLGAETRDVTADTYASKALRMRTIAREALPLARQLIEDYDEKCRQMTAWQSHDIELQRERTKLREENERLKEWRRQDETRLSAAEETIESLRFAAENAHQELLRAEEAIIWNHQRAERAEEGVKAAKRGCERDPLYQCPNCRSTAEVLRRFEEGR